jgi:hypothetical protein
MTQDAPANLFRKTSLKYHKKTQTRATVLQLVPTNRVNKLDPGIIDPTYTIE